MKKIVARNVLILVLALTCVVIACQKENAMLDVGVPRAETLVVDVLSGNTANPWLVNPYVPGAVPWDAGFHQLIFAHLWEINTMSGEQFPELAAEMPVPLDDTMTRFQFRVREGLVWSDGVPFTAEDVEYTAQMILNTPELGFHGYFASLVGKVTAVDKYTVQIETVRPEAKLATKLGVVIFGQAFKIMPKHIWENEDPRTFRFEDAVGIGSYRLTGRDTVNGSWFLFEKRDDWRNSVDGQIAGEPGPKYVLFRSFGPESNRIMAMLNNEIDILQDITPESMGILLDQSKTVRAWYPGFPYAQMDDPCARGLSFNNLRPPFDNVDIRWALALAMDIQSVSMATFGGMLRVTPIPAPPTTVLQENYHFPMYDWFRSFSLRDGYMPFDDTYATSIVERLRAEGVEGLPATDRDAVSVFGVGWFKYDREKASELLTRNGYTFTNGSWFTPEGNRWQITIGAPADFEIQSMRLAFAVADAWRSFGIDASVRQMDAASYWNAEALGDFAVAAYWPACGLMPDTSMNMQTWHMQYVVPPGERASGNFARWSNSTASAILDEAAVLPPEDPRVVELMTGFYQEMVREIPFLPMFGTSKFVPVNTKYWEGFQTAENPFEGPWWWWSQFKYYLHNLSPAT